MKAAFFRSTLALALALAFAVPAFAADPVPAATSAVVASNGPAERFDAGILAVERHGNRGVPLILVPGLSSGAWAWQDLVRRLKGEHVIYVVTLPGFDGRAAVPGPVFDKVGDSLRQLIAARKLDRPVVIGHSLGGALAIALGETDARLLRGVVAIDGLPVFPGTEQTPPAMRGQMAQAMKARMAAQDPAKFAEQQQQYMHGMGVIEPKLADELGALSARSDPAAVASIMAELLEKDLRAGLPNIKVPLLLVAPYYDKDGTLRGISQPMAKEYYTSLMAGTPQLTVASIAPSRHFVMFDQPEQLEKTLRDFIKPL